MIRAQQEAASTAEVDRSSSVFKLVEERSQLAQELKKIFVELKTTGQVNSRINSFSEILFCLPQSANANQYRKPTIAELRNFFSIIRPYHALVLLQPWEEIKAQLPLGTNEAVKTVIRAADPRRNLNDLCGMTVLNKKTVWTVACSLVSWGKAIIVFPLSAQNQYVLSPLAEVSARLKNKFAEAFPDLNYVEQLERLSLPTRVAGMLPVTATQEEKEELEEVILWFLRNRLLMQLHYYPVLNLSSKDEVTTFKDPLDDVVMPVLSPVESDDDNGYPGQDITDEVVMGTCTSIWYMLSYQQSCFAASGRRLAKVQAMTRDDMLALFKDDERVQLAKNKAAADEEELRVFIRLLPYLANGHHVESIMFYEHLDRYQVMDVCDKFALATPILLMEDAKLVEFLDKKRQR